MARKRMVTNRIAHNSKVITTSWVVESLAILVGDYPSGRVRGSSDGSMPLKGGSSCLVTARACLHDDDGEL